ncbi:flagellar biosynthetic protein FliR [Paractinoplanes ferrugineus]|uniref:Flagellar biosynthetic protein FliR n=1 Tax=Paractinoplanes ferrugineus TaxID=113564 RepID=A0A919IUM9_9ACTN|nr:flagellar biosynthetic protein FliR [Actinoplanes ferrugineus]GIE08423.1 flagellar biosynthetic protein FliR [Actinoplanes ferrugineus]
MNWNVPIADLLAIMLGSARTGAFLMISPPFNSRFIPGNVKVLLSIGLTLPLAPYLRGTIPSLETADILASAALQVFVGASLGFLVAMLFAALQAAGDLLDVFGGFTLAMGYDPLSMNQSSVFGRFYNLIAVTILFATEGHQMILRGFLQSFRTMPLNLHFDLPTLSQLLLKGLGELFVAALQIAGPLVIVLFLTDVAFGLLNRVAPALNAFQLGFPAKILVLLLLSGMAITLLPPVIESIVEKAVTGVLKLTGG